MKQSCCPVCKSKFKAYTKTYCSSACYNKIRVGKSRKVITVKKEKLLWKEYWDIKLYNFPLREMTQKDYQDYDVIWKYEEFYNNKS